jgi:hypothetical protein
MFIGMRIERLENNLFFYFLALKSWSRGDGAASVWYENELKHNSATSLF